MPRLLIEHVEPELYARLDRWASEQGRPLSVLAHDILAAAERCRENSDPTENRSTRDIRRTRDGGCGLCDELDPLWARRCAPLPTLRLLNQRRSALDEALRALWHSSLRVDDWTAEITCADSHQVNRKIGEIEIANGAGGFATGTIKRNNRPSN